MSIFHERPLLLCQGGSSCPVKFDNYFTAVDYKLTEGGIYPTLEDSAGAANYSYRPYPASSIKHPVSNHCFEPCLPSEIYIVTAKRISPGSFRLAVLRPRFPASRPPSLPAFLPITHNPLPITWGPRRDLSAVGGSHWSP